MVDALDVKESRKLASLESLVAWLSNSCEVAFCSAFIIDSN